MTRTRHGMIAAAPLEPSGCWQRFLHAEQGDERRPRGRVSGPERDERVNTLKLYLTSSDTHLRDFVEESIISSRGFAHY